MPDDHDPQISVIGYSDDANVSILEGQLQHYLDEICLWCRLPLKRRPDEKIGDFAHRVLLCLNEWDDLFAGYIFQLETLLGANQ